MPTQNTNMFKTSERIHYIDSFRGLAALGVAWFHLYTKINERFAIGDHLAIILNYIAVWGRWGVRLFFVISGFVLAFSLQRKYLITSLSSAGKYFIKRSLRLDPTYWTAIGITLILLSLQKGTYIFDHANSISSFAQLITNLFYLNWLLDYKTVLSVSWTLALEIQLYLFFAILLYIAYLFFRFSKVSKETTVFILISVSALISLLWPLGFFNIDSTKFPGYYFIFVSGVLIYNSFIEKRYIPLFIVFDAVLIFCTIKFHDSAIFAVLISHLLIFVAQYVYLIRKLLVNAVLQYLGKLSYCIYLLHVPIGFTSATIFVWFITKFTPGYRWVYFGATVFAIICTIASSHLIYFLVEKRSIDLSKKIRFGKN
jgi:peptidoglycan/LPS O-acetylase OafA/YrhL